MTDIYHSRMTRLRQRMSDTGVDLVVAGPSSHMMWLTGLNPHGDERPVMMMISATSAGFLIPGLNADSARQKTELPFFCWDDANGPNQALDDLLGAVGAKQSGLTIALDETMRTDFSLLLLGTLDRPNHTFLHQTVGYLRGLKDDAEYQALKASALLNDAAVQHGFASLSEGMTEMELQTIIRDYYKANGAAPEFTIVGFGANGAFPHHHTGQTRLERDMAILVDTGCRYQGYPSDMTRCGWFGDPEPEYLKVAGVVEGAVRAAVDAARPGMKASELDKVARDHITQAGYGKEFLHRLGHGVGIDVHEPPYITATSDTILEVGNVFSIEPGIYLKDRFGIRLEDIVIMRENGAEILSNLPRDLVISTG